MQPRRLREPERGETVFQVTKSGDSVKSLARWLVRRPILMGVNLSVEVEGVVSAVEGSREEEEEEEPGVEDPEGVSRCRVGLRGLRDFDVVSEGFEVGSLSSSAASSSAESSWSSNPLG